MLKKVITVQANTVEDAIQQALDMLETRRDQVNIEILTNPGRRLMGLRKVMAEVKVSRKEHIEEKKPVERQLSKIEELAGLLDGIDMDTIAPSSTTSKRLATAQISTLESDQILSSARIQDGEIQFQFSEDPYHLLYQVIKRF